MYLRCQLSAVSCQLSLRIVSRQCTSGASCQNAAIKGKDYSGKVAETKGGHECKVWKDTSKASVGDHNYCRNPSSGNALAAHCCEQFQQTPNRNWFPDQIAKCQGTMPGPSHWAQIVISCVLRRGQYIVRSKAVL